MKNHCDFINMKSLETCWHIVEDGNATNPVKTETLDVPHGETRSVFVPSDQSQLLGEACFIVEGLFSKNETWPESGRVIAWSFHII